MHAFYPQSKQLLHTIRTVGSFFFSFFFFVGFTLPFLLLLFSRSIVQGDVEVESFTDRILTLFPQKFTLYWSRKMANDFAQ